MSIDIIMDHSDNVFIGHSDEIITMERVGNRSHINSDDKLHFYVVIDNCDDDITIDNSGIIQISVPRDFKYGILQYRPYTPYYSNKNFSRHLYMFNGEHKRDKILRMWKDLEKPLQIPDIIGYNYKYKTIDLELPIKNLNNVNFDYYIYVKNSYRHNYQTCICEKIIKINITKDSYIESLTVYRTESEITTGTFAVDLENYKFVKRDEIVLLILIDNLKKGDTIML